VKRVVSRDEGEERSRSWKGPAAGILDKKKKKGIGSPLVIGISVRGRGGERRRADRQGGRNYLGHLMARSVAVSN